MSPDDKRPEPRANAGEAPHESAEPVPGVDDLEALAGDLATTSAGDGHKDEDDANLGALAAVGGRRFAAGPRDGSAAPRDGAAGPRDEADVLREEEDSRLDLARLVGSQRLGSPPAADAPAEAAADASGSRRVSLAHAPDVEPSSPPRSASWLVPLLVGLGLGLGLAGGAFLLAGKHGGEASQAPARTEPAPSAAAPSAAANAVMPGQDSRPLGTTAVPDPAPSVGQNPVASEAPRVDPALSSPRASAAAKKPPAPVVSPVPPSPAPRAERAVAAPGDQAHAPRPVLPGEEPANAAASGDRDEKRPRSMDALLDDALSPSARSAESERQRALAASQDQLPQTPSRDDVTQAMTVLLPAIHGCAMGQSGLATAGIVVRGDGRVASVEIAGAPFAGTASGRCMEGVIRRAHFPRFKQPAFRIRFPLAIQ